MTPDERLDQIEIIFVELSVQLGRIIARNDEFMAALTRQNEQINLLRRAMAENRQVDFKRKKMPLRLGNVPLDLSRLFLN